MSDIVEVDIDQIEVLQKVWRKQIINSVANKGITTPSSRDQNLGSTDHSVADSQRHKYIYGVVVVASNSTGVTIEKTTPNQQQKYYTVECPVGSKKVKFSYELDSLKNQKVEDISISSALYSGTSSVFPVLLERPNEDKNESYNQPGDVINDRTNNSFLIICIAEKLNLEGIGGREAFIRGNILPNQFLAILSPKSVLKEVLAGFSGSQIPVIEVGEKQVLFPDRREQSQITVPDYESEVKKWLEVSGVPLFLHGVRLPTKEDVNQRTKPVP